MRRLTYGTERCGRGALRATALLTLLTALFVAPAAAGAATAGGLKQFSGTSGCFSDEDPVAAGCAEGRAIAGVGDVVVSPDGENAYVTSTTSNAIAIFDRNTTTGRLTQKSGVLGCITVTAGTATSEDCNLIAPGDVNVLTGPTALALSPDNQSLYVVSNQGRVAGFNRASNGSLTFNNSSNLCGDGCALTALAVSPDGASVYPAGPGSSGIIATYQRNETAGATLGDITFRGCRSVTTCGGGVPSNLGTVSEVAVTPDNEQLLILNSNNTALLSWDRVVSGAAIGDLTASAVAARCVAHNTLATCQQRQSTINPQSLAVADSGTRILVGAQQGLATISRDAATGNLSPQTDNCFSYPTNPFPGCTATPGATCCTTFFPAREVVVTPDSRLAYFGTESSNATIWGFNRSGSGTLSLIPTPLRCASVTAADTCGTFRQGNRIQEMSAAPGNRHVYAGGNNRVWGFEIDRPPVCQNVSAGTTNNASVTVTLNCSDPDGDALTFEKVPGTGPSRGTLADIQGNGVSYGPQPGTTGVDTFQYRARGAGVASDPATASVNVTAPPVVNPPVVNPPVVNPPLSVLPSTTSINSLAFVRFTKLQNLSAKNLVAGSTVTVTCKTKKKGQQKKGCPYKRKRFTTSGARASLNLRKPFAKKRVPVGTKITISIAAANFIGKRITYTIRRRKIPKSLVQCVPPGGKAGRCA